MKRILLFSLVFILFALDWAALHDIIKGNETNYLAEYSMIFFSLIGFIFIFHRLAVRKPITFSVSENKDQSKQNLHP